MMSKMYLSKFFNALMMKSFIIICYNRYILTGILTGLVLSSNDICLNTQLSVKVNIFTFANIGVLKL